MRSILGKREYVVHKHNTQHSSISSYSGSCELRKANLRQYVTARTGYIYHIFCAAVLYWFWEDGVHLGGRITHRMCAKKRDWISRQGIAVIVEHQTRLCNIYGNGLRAATFECSLNCRATLMRSRCICWAQWLTAKWTHSGWLSTNNAAETRIPKKDRYFLLLIRLIGKTRLSHPFCDGDLQPLFSVR